MDKSVTFAVAGSGKTSLLVANLDLAKRFKIVTYTEANADSLRRKIIQKFGHLPKNIEVSTYFSFLYGFCYRPFLSLEKKTKGVIFEFPTRNYALSDERRYMTPGRWLYSNRLASYVTRCCLLTAIRNRLEKYYDAFFVDEVQDFAGHDFNLLIEISKANVEINFVGDFYQHTFDTSRDGNVNGTLHDNYDAYQKRFRDAGLRVDTDSLRSSRRCSSTVCSFITERLGITILPHDERASEVRLENDPTAAEGLYRDMHVVKLFLKEHYKYECFSQNWGASKGVDHYDHVCIVLSANNAKALRNGKLQELPSSTRNKLYVACSRARGNLTFVPEVLLKHYKTV
ncbi:DNA helicase UvrD [Stenotrophomonas sp. Betaine-02u-21]|uniref:AAA family ATPase n=1 Tax=unclassified Stenotrophomonas TaxID=196198 RepID=UPI000C3493EF|nr:MULTISPECIES: AAA family ATPase [unclassified Stenotrophomonas]PKH70891.1 DNA helicase UvrD [Stenotrophomonas sp. Betaine-02u-23]PKH72709.1 DNA helicase UvrD [Stenotrophomonas sp. Betaine-02u-21]PKH97116.1 DNA helicase UvrD [Stenotrophomonas sp. Bg11-02]